MLQASIQTISRDWATLSSGLFADLRSLASGVQSFLSVRPFRSCVDVLNKNPEHPRCKWDVKNVGRCLAVSCLSGSQNSGSGGRSNELVGCYRLMRFDLSTISLCREHLHGPCAGWRRPKEGKVEESSKWDSHHNSKGWDLTWWRRFQFLSNHG